ncbi:MAG: hypothetical protein ACLUD0_07925 [Eubacterium ramulus]
MKSSHLEMQSKWGRLHEKDMGTDRDTGNDIFILAGCGQDKVAEKDASLSAGNETTIENGVGLASVVSIEDVYYYNDLLTTDEGEVYALTDGTSEEGTDPVLVWKSTDQGENWEKVIKLPDTIYAGSFISDRCTAGGRG